MTTRDTDALVLRPGGGLAVEPFPIDEPLSATDVRITSKAVGVCGSDLHYVDHGAIGPFVVEDPMVLGHEASGVVTEVGAEVTDLVPGDRVCMEPGVPCPWSRATLQGQYNLDSGVKFWATPPVHGVLRPSFVHPAAFTFKLPDNVSFEEGAFVEPLAVAVHSVDKASLRVADSVVILGAGTIGLLIARVVLAAGASSVIVSDVNQRKLDVVAGFDPRVIPVNSLNEDINEVAMAATDEWGADAVFEASGAASAAAGVFGSLRPGGTVVFVGMPAEPIEYDVPAGQVKEASVQHVFRYVNVYPRAIRLLGSRTVRVDDLVTHRFTFRDSAQAFDAMRDPHEGVIKAQILFDS